MSQNQVKSFPQPAHILGRCDPYGLDLVKKTSYYWMYDKHTGIDWD